MKKNNIKYDINGISVITLIITVIIALILATASINAFVKKSGIKEQAQLSTITSHLSEVMEEYNLYITENISEARLNNKQYNKTKLYADENCVKYADEVIENSISDIMPAIKDSEKDKYKIVDGIIYYMSSDELSTKAAEELGYTVIKLETEETNDDEYIYKESKFGDWLFSTIVEIVENNETKIRIIKYIIIAIIILVLVKFLFGKRGTLAKIKKNDFKNHLFKIKREYNFYLSNNVKDGFNQNKLSASANYLRYDGKDIGKNISEIIPYIKESEKKYFQIAHGILYYKTTDEHNAIIAKDLGYSINPLNVENGVLLANINNMSLIDSNGVLDLTIFDDFEKIGTQAFMYSEREKTRYDLKKVIISKNVKEIEKEAFANNEHLREVVLETGLEKIDDGAFMNCTSLEEIKFPETLKEIGDQAFRSCTSLISIRLPKSIEKMGNNVFVFCTNLTDFHDSKENDEQIF